MEKRCARKASAYIRDDMIIGLGGGSIIAHLARSVKENGEQAQAVTSSLEMEALYIKLGPPLPPLCQISRVDIAFDGCDEANRQFYTLKNGGGIHARERLTANMAEECMLPTNKSKLSDTLQFHMPVVMELLEDAAVYVEHRVKGLQGRFVCKHGEGRCGVVMDDRGNILADVRLDKVEDPERLNHVLRSIAGVTNTSLLAREITATPVVSDQGFELLKKGSV